ADTTGDVREGRGRGVPHTTASCLEARQRVTDGASPVPEDRVREVRRQRVADATSGGDRGEEPVEERVVLLTLGTEELAVLGQGRLEADQRVAGTASHDSRPSGREHARDGAHATGGVDLVPVRCPGGDEPRVRVLLRRL